jgi:hypothetical protein
MTRYRNRGGNSGVKAYEIGQTFIKVELATGEIYVYDNINPGKEHVEKMKILAQAGKGLSTYITRHVKENYADKLS